MNTALRKLLATCALLTAAVIPGAAFSSPVAATVSNAAAIAPIDPVIGGTLVLIHEFVVVRSCKVKGIKITCRKRRQ